MKKTKEQKGITLISLVITIILLLILATVAINLAVDSDGLFSKAGDAANKWNSSVATEKSAIEDLLGTLDAMSPTPVTLSTDLPEGWSSDVISQVAIAGNKKAPIPVGFTASGVEGENTISEGLVIYDTTETVTDSSGLTVYDQYVWIPVDDINDMVMCSECGGSKENLVYDDATKTLKCTNTHEGTPTLAGKLYIGRDEDIEDTEVVVTVPGYGEETGYSRKQKINFERNDQMYSTEYEMAGNREPAIITGNTGTYFDGDANNYHGLGTAEAFLAQLKSDFDNMARSVAKYKGFYISRYEIQEGVQSKKGLSILNASVTSANMWYGLYRELRSNPDISTPTYSQMIWGSQYDQVIKFIGEEAQIGHADRNIILSSPMLGTATVSGNTPLDKMKNIYDLEGNYWEWTAEATGEDEIGLRGARNVRGYGLYIDTFLPASFRFFYAHR